MGWDSAIQLKCPLCPEESNEPLVSLGLLVDHLHENHALCFCGKVYRYQNEEDRNQAIIDEATAQAFEDPNAAVKNPFVSKKWIR